MEYVSLAVKDDLVPDYAELSMRTFRKASKPWQYHNLVFALKFAYPVKSWRKGWAVYQQGVFI